MKLLLASDSTCIMNVGFAAIGIPLNKLRIGYVTTAAKVAIHLDFLVRPHKVMQTARIYYEEYDNIDRKETFLGGEEVKS